MHQNVKSAFSLGMFVFFLSAILSPGQYTPGTTNHIVADGVTGVDYLLYVPTSYTATNPPPLVIYFDPGGFSLYGMQRLQPSCQQAGWILACPNVLKNGTVPLQKLIEREVIDDVWRRISYDRSRMYASGLSGGSWRVNELSRQYSGEFAGSLLFGCWIGLYDDFDVFPDRLAVARSNGDADSAAIYYEAIDLPYYTQTAVRVRDFRFTGGHEIGPPGTTSVAIAWLNQDFVSNGIAYVPAAFETIASNAIAAANDAWASSNYVTAVTNAVRVLYDYPISTSVRTAEQFVVRAFGNDAIRETLNLVPLPTNDWAISWMLMQRAHSVMSDFPKEYPIGYLEASIAYSPTNWLALGYLSTELSDDSDLRWRHLQRVFQLAEQARLIKTNYWYGWHAMAQAYAGVGSMKKAAALSATAYSSITYDPGGATRYNAHEFVDQYIPYALQYQSLPRVDDFDDYPLDVNVDGRLGWITPWGSAVVQDGVTHATCTALCMTGNPCVVRRNFNERTNTVIWTDFYIRPSYATTTGDPPVLPDVGALYYVNSNGQLRVYDGSAGITSWITLANAPLLTDAWSRITVEENYGAQAWAVSVNDTPVQSGLGFANSTNVFTAICLIHQTDLPTYVDTMTISTSAPPADTDFDGLPDTWESANGASNPNDDEDGDLFLNLEEYRNQTSPLISNAPPASAHLAVTLIRNSLQFPIGELDRRNAPCRHYLWDGDVIVAATNNASIRIATLQTNFSTLSWGDTNLTSLSLPARGTVVSGYGDISLTGPVNTLCHFQYDELSKEFSITNVGLHDADGDLMMDEWELQYFGSIIAGEPFENPDHDAYVNLNEYFNGFSPTSYDLFSPYRSISLPGTYNGWNAAVSFHMILVADHLWKMTLITDVPGPLAFKFAANDSWDVNWGDNNPTSSITPFRGQADSFGSDIAIQYPNTTYISILFNDQTLAYGVILSTNDIDSDGIRDSWEVQYYTNVYAESPYDNEDGDKYCNADEYINGTHPHVSDGWASEYTSVSVPGTFNGWNPAANNMQLITNHLWRYEATFQQQAGVAFKYAANGNWTLAWGDPSQTNRRVPFYGQGDPTPGSADLLLNEVLDGVYWFTFHDLSGVYSLEYAPQYIVLKSGAQPMSTGAISLSWTSATNHRYSVWRYTNLLNQAQRVAMNIIATPPLTIHTQLLTNASSAFFSIRMDP